MEAGLPVQLLLPLVIAALMLAVGLKLQGSHFRALLAAPLAALTGLACMLMLFPLLAWALALLLPLAPELALGLVLLAASPSASTSTLFADLAGGDTALSVALTAASKLLPVVMIPLWLGLAAPSLAGDEMPFMLAWQDLTEMLSLVVLLPLLAGMWLRQRHPSLALRLRPPLLRAGVALLVVLIGLLVWRDRSVLPEMLLSAGPAALLLCVSGSALVWLIAHAMRIRTRQRRALVVEVCMQSGGTSIAIAAGVLGNPLVAIPAAVYSVIMYVAAAGLVLASRLHDRILARAADR